MELTGHVTGADRTQVLERATFIAMEYFDAPRDKVRVHLRNERLEEANISRNNEGLTIGMTVEFGADSWATVTP